MCGPWVLPVLQIGAMALGAYAQVQQGRATQEAANYNAEIARRNAEFAEADREIVHDQAAIDRRRRGVEAQQDIGEVRARAAAMGLDSEFGTFDDLQSDVKQAYRIDRSILNQNEIERLKALDREAWSYRAGGNLQEAQGRSAVRAGNLAAAGSLLEGSANVASRWIRPPTGRAASGQHLIPIGG